MLSLTAFETWKHLKHTHEEDQILNRADVALVGDRQDFRQDTSLPATTHTDTHGRTTKHTSTHSGIQQLRLSWGRSGEWGGRRGSRQVADRSEDERGWARLPTVPSIGSGMFPCLDNWRWVSSLHPVRGRRNWGSAWGCQIIRVPSSQGKFTTTYRTFGQTRIAGGSRMMIFVGSLRMYKQVCMQVYGSATISDIPIFLCEVIWSYLWCTVRKGNHICVAKM